MTDLDTELIPAADEIVAEYGKSVTFTVKTRAYNPGLGATEETETNYTDIVTPPDAYDSQYIDGDVIREGDVKILIPAQNIAFTPDAGVEVTIDGTVWTVVRVKPIYSGTSIAVYEMQLRS